MKDHSVDSKETSRKEDRHLPDVIAEYQIRQAKTAELALYVRTGIDVALTTLFGQAQLLLREELSATARRRIAAIAQQAASIRDAAALLGEIEAPHDDVVDVDKTQISVASGC